jgi:tRNA(Ile2) C34 agmatinyltransferase TiaS
VSPSLAPCPPPARGPALAGDGRGHGASTLEEMLDARLRPLIEHGACRCPVCGGRMGLEGRVGRCRDCGSGLA